MISQIKSQLTELAANDISIYLTCDWFTGKTYWHCYDKLAANSTEQRKREYSSVEAALLAGRKLLKERDNADLVS